MKKNMAQNLGEAALWQSGGEMSGLGLIYTFCKYIQGKMTIAMK